MALQIHEMKRDESVSECRNLILHSVYTYILYSQARHERPKKINKWTYWYKLSKWKLVQRRKTKKNLTQLKIDARYPNTGWPRSYRRYLLQISQPSQYGYVKLQYRFAVNSGSPSMCNHGRPAYIFRFVDICKNVNLNVNLKW